jgi:hypothetical protein
VKNLAIRRYTEYVDSQPATTFTPIRQSTLHGVVSKLMRNSDEVLACYTCVPFFTPPLRCTTFTH